MKKISLISLISFFLLIPNINAADDYTEKTTFKYHYYYFSEPYNNNDAVQSLINNGTINYTRFANYREWEIPSAEEVALSNSCSTNSDNSGCWNLAKFYAMWDALEYGTVVCKGDTCSRDLQEEQAGINRYYHAHGAHSSSIPAYGAWSGIVTRSDTSYNTTVNINNLSTAGKYSQMACATLQTKNDLERVNSWGYEVSDGTKTDNTYIAINRQISDSSFNPEEEISWSETSTGNASNCGDKITAYKGTVYSPALYRVTTKTTTYNCKNGSSNENGTCNNTITGSASCGKKTITVTDGGSADNPETAMAMAVVSFRQDYSMTNILTPTTIYQGGGVKIGFLYNTTVTVNQISIQYDNANGKEEDLQQLINDRIRTSILGKDAIESNIKNGASTLYLEDENRKQYTIGSAQMQVECSQKGDIINDGKVTTTCTILLPKSEVELGTGNVEYTNSTGNGINNEFYTPIKYNGNLYLHAQFKNLGAATGLWSPDITVTYDGKTNSSSNCTINTYPRFYNEDNKTYKFIYRPIDINNPFPNRNAGVNWYDWYNDAANQTRLESSYKKLEYQMILYNQTVSQIKEYNRTHKNYLDWKGIDKDTGESDFVKEYRGDTP